MATKATTSKTFFELVNASLADLRARPEEDDSPRTLERQRQVQQRIQHEHGSVLPGHQALYSVQNLDQQMSVFSPVESNTEQDTDQADQSDCESQAHAPLKTPGRAPHDAAEPAGVSAAATTPSSRSRSPSPAAPTQQLRESRPPAQPELVQRPQLARPGLCSSPSPRGIKLRSARISGPRQSSSLAPHNARDVKEISDLKAKNKRLAELLVAARDSQAQLQAKLSRSERQMEAARPLQQRVKQLQEELGKARAEAEQLGEQLAAEKRKLKSQGQRMEMLKDQQKSWFEKKEEQLLMNERLRQALALLHPQFEVALQELAAAADQVVVVKGQAAAHKRAHDAALEGAGRLAQQVAQLDQLSAQLTQRLAQQVARREEAEAAAARTQQQQLQVLPAADSSAEAAGPLSAADAIAMDVHQLQALVATQQQQLRMKTAQLEEAKQHCMELQRHAALGLQHQARASKMSQHVRELMADVEAATAHAATGQAAANASGAVAGRAVLAVAAAQNLASPPAPAPAALPSREQADAKPQLCSVHSTITGTAKRASLHAACSTTGAAAAAPEAALSPQLHPAASAPSSPSQSSQSAGALAAGQGPLPSSAPASPALQQRQGWRGGSPLAAQVLACTPAAPDSMSRRASLRTQQIAEEIAALKVKLSMLRDDVSSNRLGSRHSSWYHTRYLGELQLEQQQVQQQQGQQQQGRQQLGRQQVHLRNANPALEGEDLGRGPRTKVKPGPRALKF